jgi:DNA-binding transcriptional regulator YiaG
MPMQTQKNIQEQAISVIQSADSKDSQTSLSTAMVEKVSCRKAIIVLNNSGIQNIAIADYLNCSTSTVYRWIQFNAKVDSLADRLRSGRKAI